MIASVSIRQWHTEFTPEIKVRFRKGNSEESAEWQDRHYAVSESSVDRLTSVLGRQNARVHIYFGDGLTSVHYLGLADRR